jgi:hypothetical protein
MRNHECTVGIKAKPTFMPIFQLTTRLKIVVQPCRKTLQRAKRQILVLTPRNTVRVKGGDGGGTNSKHGPTVADALRDLSRALDRLANTLDEVSPNLLEP